MEENQKCADGSCGSCPGCTASNGGDTGASEGGDTPAAPAPAEGGEESSE